MVHPPVPRTVDSRRWGLKLALFTLWLAVSFGVCFHARALQWMVAGWPVGYWVAAQGAVLVFIAIVAVYAWSMNRLEAREASPDVAPREGPRGQAGDG